MLSVVQDGLGDTIRVSLTEPPKKEIDPCRRLTTLGMNYATRQVIDVVSDKTCCSFIIYDNAHCCI